MINNRAYEIHDYEKIINFLREIYLKTGNQYCWLPQRWEYAEYNCNDIALTKGWRDWKETIRIWEDDNKIVGIAHKEMDYDVFLQIRPGYEFLAKEMLEYLEETIPEERNDEDPELVLFINEDMLYLEEMLIAKGYTKDKNRSYFNHLALEDGYKADLPEGFSFVDGTEVKDQKERQLCCHLGFHPEDEPKTLPEWGFSMESAPMFDPKLEIMTKDASGNLCSFCVVWYDSILNIGMFEPVCTRKAYRKKGLGKAMIIEGLRRLKAMGVKKAYVESYGEDRKSFYNKAGFITYDGDYAFRKKF